MIKLTSIFGVAALLFVVTPASAASFVMWLDTCSPGTYICNPAISPAVYFTLEGGAVAVTVTGTYRGEDSFGLNLAGSSSGLMISNLTPEYSVTAGGQVIGPFGSFEYVFNGPPPVLVNATTPPRFGFTLTRDGGFLSPFDVFEMNDLGFYAGGREVNFFGGDFFVASTQIQPYTAPEPSSALLLGSGLVAFWRSRRFS